MIIMKLNLMKVPRDLIVLIFIKVGLYLVPILQKLGSYLVLNKGFHFQGLRFPSLWMSIFFDNDKHGIWY